jgi:hypothetical protein
MNNSASSSLLGIRSDCGRGGMLTVLVSKQEKSIQNTIVTSVKNKPGTVKIIYFSLVV